MDFDFIIPIALFMIVAYVIKVLSDNRVRNKLIEKGIIDENVKYLYENRQEYKNFSSLKWGLVLIGLGLALFIGQLFPGPISDEMTVGGMFLFAGIAFTIYYFIARKYLKTNEQISSKV